MDIKVTWTERASSGNLIPPPGLNIDIFHKLLFQNLLNSGQSGAMQITHSWYLNIGGFVNRIHSYKDILRYVTKNKFLLDGTHMIHAFLDAPTLEQHSHLSSCPGRTSGQLCFTGHNFNNLRKENPQDQSHTDLTLTSYGFWDEVSLILCSCIGIELCYFLKVTVKIHAVLALSPLTHASPDVARMTSFLSCASLLAGLVKRFVGRTCWWCIVKFGGGVGQCLGLGEWRVKRWTHISVSLHQSWLIYLVISQPDVYIANEPSVMVRGTHAWQASLFWMVQSFASVANSPLGSSFHISAGPANDKQQE